MVVGTALQSMKGFSNFLGRMVTRNALILPAANMSFLKRVDHHRNQQKSCFQDCKDLSWGFLKSASSFRKYCRTAKSHILSFYRHQRLTKIVLLQEGSSFQNVLIVHGFFRIPWIILREHFILKILPREGLRLGVGMPLSILA